MRDVLIRIRVTQAESKALRELANARGLTLSELIRRAALGVRFPRAIFDRRDVDLLVKVSASLGKVGGNLNQLVRQVNRGRLYGIDQLPSILASLENLRAEIRGLIR